MTKTFYSGTCPVVVTWKAVKHFNLRLSHTTGQVHLSAPLRASEAQVAEVIAAKAKWIASVTAKGKKILARQSEVLTDQHKAYLHHWLQHYIDEWSNLLNVQVAEVKIKEVRSYWGKCFPHSGRVYFSLRLALYPPKVIEYIVVHELLHFHIHNHGKSFHQAMNRLLPDWRERNHTLQ